MKKLFKPGHTFSLKHGHYVGNKPSPTYQSWHSMMNRCYQETNASYKRYGGAGIKVCKRWHNFESFLTDMGERPTGMTLDRKYSDRDYSLANCRWSTTKQQARERTVLCGASVILMRYMHKRGAKNKMLANAFGVHQTTISHIIHGNRRVEDAWNGMEGAGGVK